MTKTHHASPVRVCDTPVLMRELIASCAAADAAREPMTLEYLERDKRQRLEAGRLRNLEPWRGKVRPDDVQRILCDDVDSDAWVKVGKPFMHGYETGRCRFLWLSGPIGVGKTIVGLNIIAKHGGFVLSAAELARAVTGNTEEAQRLRREAMRARVLLIDDVGGGSTEEKRTKARDLQEPHIYSLVDGRQGFGATILTSNLTMTEIERFDAPTLSRIRGQGAIVVVTGKDLRRRE